MILPEAPLIRTAQGLLAREGLNTDEAHRLVRIFDRGDGRRLKNGEIIFAEGAPGDSMAILVEGEVRVTMMRKTGETRELAILPAPVMLGHIALIDAAPRSATVTAKGEILLVSISRERFREITSQRSRDADMLRDLMLGAMFRQLASTTGELRRLMLLTPDTSIDVKADR
jgi:CRP-like cAMP-binding protein